MTEKTTSFALRMPPELKAAAAALKDVHSLYRPSRNGKEGNVDGLRTSSINDVICTLMIEGLEPMLGYVQAALDEATKEYEGWQQIMQFLLATPTVNAAKTSDFPEGSPAIEPIEYWQDWKDPDPSLGDEDYAAYEARLVGLGIDREHAGRGYAWSQKKVLGLTEAKGAIMNVLEPLEARAKETYDEAKARIERECADRRAEREKEQAERAKAEQKRRGPQLSVVTTESVH